MNNKEIILNQLFKKPTYKFHIRELARTTKLSPNTIINLTNELVKDNIIHKEKRKHLVEVSLNLDNDKVIQQKKLFNLQQIYNSEIIEFLVNEYNPQSISLIGSFSRGEDIEKSDIDIVINTKKTTRPNIEKFQDKLQRPIQILLFSDRKKLSNEFFNNLINGITLYGTIKL